MATTGDGGELPPDAKPTPLTRRALFDLELGQMRERGEPTEGMSLFAPARGSWSSHDDDSHMARFIALRNGTGPNKKQTPSEVEWDQYLAELASKIPIEERIKEAKKREMMWRGLDRSAADALAARDKMRNRDESQPKLSTRQIREFKRERGEDWRHIFCIAEDLVQDAKAAGVELTKADLESVDRLLATQDAEGENSVAQERLGEEREIQRGPENRDCEQPGGPYETSTGRDQRSHTPIPREDYQNEKKQSQTSFYPRPASAYRRSLDRTGVYIFPNLEETQWDHRKEFKLLQDEMREATRFEPGERSLFHSLDTNAFSGENNSQLSPSETSQDLAVPANFPPYRIVDGLTELGGYLAASSYIVSLGGPPLPELKYGIIIVPAGEEALLFAGSQDDDAMSPEFKAEVYAKSKAVQMEEPQEFLPDLPYEMSVNWRDHLDEDDKKFYEDRWRARRAREEEIGIWHWLPIGNSAEYKYNNRSPSRSPPVPRAPTASDRSYDKYSLAEYQDEGDGKTSRHTRQRNRAIPCRRSVWSQISNNEKNKSNSVEPDIVDKGSAPQGITPRSNSPPDVDSREGATHRNAAREEAPRSLPDPEVSEATGEPFSPWAGEAASDDGNTSTHHQANQDGDVTELQSESKATCRASPTRPTQNPLETLPIQHSMTPEALQALELLLTPQPQAKRNKRYRFFDSLLDRKKPRVQTKLPDLEKDDIHRLVLFQVTEAMTGLANGELRENPGIDSRVWESARRVVTDRPITNDE